MDATQCYLAMYRAMRDGDLRTARQRARQLKAWLEQGGLGPQFYAPEEVRGYLASVLRRTGSVDLPPESPGECESSPAATPG